MSVENRTVVRKMREIFQLENPKAHVRSRISPRSDNCSECGRNFYSSSNFNEHMTFHTNRKPDGCSECGKNSTEKPIWVITCKAIIIRNSFSVLFDAIRVSWSNYSEPVHETISFCKGKQWRHLIEILFLLLFLVLCSASVLHLLNASDLILHLQFLLSLITFKFSFCVSCPFSL